MAGGAPAANSPGRLANYISGVSAAQDWLQGQAAAAFGGIGFARQALQSAVPSESVALLPAPAWGTRPANPPAACLGLAVMGSNAPGIAQAEAAWTLVEWLALGEPAAERYPAGLGLPASRDRVDWETGPGLPQWSAVVRREVEETGSKPLPHSPRVDLERVIEVWNRQEERYLIGEIGLEEMLDIVEEESVRGFNG